MVLRNLQFRNLRSGVLSWAGANIAVFDCGFTDIWHSLFFDRGTGVVENCDFFNSDIDGLHLFSYFQSGLSISNCSFLQVDSDEVGHGIFVNISGEVDATISQCTFLGGGVGCQVDRGGNVDIFNSVFEDNTGHAVYLGTGGAYANVIDCRITNCYRGFLCFRTPYTLTVERTVFENIGMAAFVFNYLESGFVRDCLLDGGERGVVAYYPNQSPAEVNKSLVYDFDMRNNYWGTTDPDSIQILIEDNFDDPSIDYRVLWEPFLDQPVSSQKSTLESLKSRFR